MYLDSKKIIKAISTARRNYKAGTLKDPIRNAVHESFWQNDEKTSVQNKRQLLKLAENGAERPNKRKHSLGQSLINYTNKSSVSFDSEFNDKIRKAAPNWFANTADVNKEILINMAKNGEPRPVKRKNAIAERLWKYTNKKSVSYDPIFDKKIRKISPSWFVKTSTTNKDKLLLMAKNGEPRPAKRKNPLGSFLCYYTIKSNNSFDPIFDAQIRKIAPSWFVNTADINKQKLIEMAQNKEIRPSTRKNPLGSCLASYTRESNNSYDPIFHKKIRKLAPHWFIKTSEENKKKLLEMAKKRQPRPSKKKHPLGAALITYTNKTHACFNREFNSEIRKLAPHWF